MIDSIEDIERRIARNADKLIYSCSKEVDVRIKDPRGRKPKQLHNKLLPVFQDLRLEVFEEDGLSWPLWVDDVLSGVARLDWYRQGERSVPLSTRSLKVIFESLEYIDSASISNTLNLGERQARRYLQASFLCYKYLLKGWNDRGVRSLRYPVIRPGIERLNIAENLGIEQ